MPRRHRSTRDRICHAAGFEGLTGKALENATTEPVRRKLLPRTLTWLVKLRGSPEAIAGGVAVGMVVSFTPTMGFQTILALGLATLANANRPISIVPTWITNPVTALPIYAFTYWIGSFFWPGPDPAVVARMLADAGRELESLEFLELRDQLSVFLGLGIDIFVPLMLGGLVVGGLAAAVSYAVTLRLVQALRARRRNKRRNRRRRRKKR